MIKLLQLFFVVCFIFLYTLLMSVGFSNAFHASMHDSQIKFLAWSFYILNVGIFGTVGLVWILERVKL